MSLYEISSKYQQAFLTLCDSDFDEETINDTLEGLEYEVVEKSKNVLAYALNLESEARQLKEVEDRIVARRKAAENKSNWLKEYLKTNMAKSGITEIEAIDGTFKATLQIGRDESIVIHEQDRVPKTLCKHVPESWIPNKVEIKKVIKEGGLVDGCELVKKDRLVIK